MLGTQLLKNGSPNIIIAAKQLVENLGNPLERFKRCVKRVDLPYKCCQRAIGERAAGDSPNKGRKNGQPLSK